MGIGTLLVDRLTSGVNAILLSRPMLRGWLFSFTLSKTADTFPIPFCQRGGNVQGGVAASGSFGGALGAAAALGGGYSTSSGTRELTADTAQRISDAFSQATSAVRELRSTVVVQGHQAEAARAQTRVIANYNHGHALTIMYYEVLRHYRVLTRLVASQLAGEFVLTLNCLV